MRTSGNIYVILFAATVMAGIVGVSAQKYVMSPLKTASNVTRKNAAETQMQLGIRVAATNAVTQQGTGGDCDSDGMVEPLPYVDAGASPHPSGGGYLPANTGGVQVDPWNTQYGYCVWDHGSAVDAAGCGGAPQLRLPGTSGEEWESMAVISAGPDKVFQTTCNAWVDANANNVPDTPLVNKPSDSDDVYYAWSYQEAEISSGLWSAVGATGAEIVKNLSVKNVSNSEQLSFDSASAALALGSSGRARIPTLSTDYIQTLTSPSVLLRDGLIFFPEDGTGMSYTMQNPTGDTFEMTTGNNTRQTFSTSNITMYPTSGGDRNMQLSVSSGSTQLGIRADVNEYHSGIEMESTSYNTGMPTGKLLYIAGRHQAADGNSDYTSRIVFGQNTGPWANSAALSGYLSFETRSAGVALGGALTERMRIHENGNVTMGSVHTANANKLKTNIALFATNGNVGIGTTTPAVTLDVNGNMILGSTGGACNTARAPIMRYNPSLKCLEYCFSDGLWKCANFTACGTTLPAAFTFTNVTSATAGTVYESSIHQVTGIGTCKAMTSVSGVGTPQFRVCTNGTSDATCDASVVQDWTSSPFPVQNGQYVQLMNSVRNGGVTLTSTLTVGSRSYDWSISTTGDCSAPSPPIGTFCADGTIYIGLSPDGSTKMYSTPCTFGKTWNPQTYSCQGGSITVPWSNAGTIATGVTNDTTGEANTSTLAALANADSPYYAAKTCQDMVAHGQSDWYLPAVNEAAVLVATCAIHPDGSCSSSTLHWISRENSSSQARAFRFSGSTAVGTGKTSNNVFICVRKD